MILDTPVNPYCLISEKLNRISGVKHFFSTKEIGDYRSLLNDLKNKNDQSSIGQLLNKSEMHFNKFVYLKQVHGDIVHYIDSKNYIDKIGIDGDALITTDKEISIGIFTADCVPILLADKKLHIIAAIHAGWKGTRLGIAAKSINFMINKLGSKPEDIFAAIGPCIGECCFEVGSEVFDLFKYKHVKNGRLFVNLKKENFNQLRELGLPVDNIDDINFCTVCRDDLFYSYRREHGQTGRQASFIQMQL